MHVHGIMLHIPTFHYYGLQSSLAKRLLRAAPLKTITRMASMNTDVPMVGR